jgi:hypothetical protein
MTTMATNGGTLISDCLAHVVKVSPHSGEHPAMIVAAETVAKVADDEDQEWELRTEARRAVEDIVDLHLRAEPPSPELILWERPSTFPPREQWLQHWDFLHANAPDLLTVTRENPDSRIGGRRNGNPCMPR